MHLNVRVVLNGAAGEVLVLLSLGVLGLMAVVVGLLLLILLALVGGIDVLFCPQRHSMILFSQPLSAAAAGLIRPSLVNGVPAIALFSEQLCILISVTIIWRLFLCS